MGCKALPQEIVYNVYSKNCDFWHSTGSSWLAQWLFKITMMLKKYLFMKLQQSQHPCGSVIAIQGLDCPVYDYDLALSRCHNLICHLPCWLLSSKVNGKKPSGKVTGRSYKSILPLFLLRNPTTGCETPEISSYSVAPTPWSARLSSTFIMSLLVCWCFPGLAAFSDLLTLLCPCPLRC